MRLWLRPDRLASLVVELSGKVEQLAKGGDIPVQISLFDKRRRPYPFHQVVLLDNLSAVFYEGNENVENFRREWNWFAFAQQNTLRGLQAKASEIVTMTVLLHVKTGLEKHL